MIRMFERECGRSSINKIMAMQSDYEVSRELSKEFNQLENVGIEVDIIVVTFG